MAIDRVFSFMPFSDRKTNFNTLRTGDADLRF